MKQVVNICAYTGCMVLLFYLLLSYNGLWNFALYPEDGYYAQTIQYFLDACLTLSPASTIAASLGAISIFEIHCTVPDDKQMASKELILWSLLTILLNSYTAYLISNGAAKGLDLEIWMILIETTAINIVWYYLLLWILKKRKHIMQTLKKKMSVAVSTVKT